MKKSDTVFDFVGMIFLVYGFSILCLNVFCLLFGDSAGEYSTIFALGSRGLAVSTMLQFFLLSAVISGLRYLLFTDVLIRKLSLGGRTCLMFGLVILVMVLFIVLWGWFPVDMWLPWVMFLSCFGLSAGVSTVLSVWKERIENRKMEEALERLKREAEEEISAR